MIGLYYVGNLGVSAYAAGYNQTVITDTLSETETAEASVESTSDTASTSTASESQSTDTAATTTSPSSSTTTTSSGTTSTTTTTPSSTTTTTTTTTTSGYVDGTYTGSGTGFHNGTTKVTVTISNGQITNIQTVSTQDDGPYYNRAFSTISSEIIAAQSSSVSAVSGATFSSKGIMSAVADALSQAKG